MATPLPSVIRVEAKTNLKQIGVQPGWFVRAGSCSIWFEVQHVYDKAILVAARDPRRASDVVSVGNFFSAINEVSSVAPPHSHWIKLDRKLPHSRRSRVISSAGLLCPTNHSPTTQVKSLPYRSRLSCCSTPPSSSLRPSSCPSWLYVAWPWLSLTIGLQRMKCQLYSDRYLFAYSMSLENLSVSFCTLLGRLSLTYWSPVVL